MIEAGPALLLAVVLLVAGQRLWELRRSRRHEALLRAQGAVEEGRFLYPWIVALHAAFLGCLLLEGWWRGPGLGPLWGLWLGLYVAAQALRFWTLRALGVRWSTRLLVVPGMELATGGPYRFLRHPNYLAVGVELLALPLLFGAVFTAIGATVVNMLLLALRVRQEEALLSRLTNYEVALGGRPRLIPRRPPTL
ncbi:MAG: isoprenylcysteine carboxyl methyltransferase family protein [Candidatus Tectimicrobiota bacterium]